MNNIGKMALAHDLDLAAIAETAGQADPEKRWYDEGVLYVQGVADADLAEAVEKVNSAEAVAARDRLARIAEINTRFAQIDEAAARPTRVIAAGLGTEADKTILYFLEVEAEALRAELRQMGETSC